MNYRQAGSLENTDLVMERLFWIGVYPGIKAEMLQYIKETFKKFFTLQKMDTRIEKGERDRRFW
jgi:dTDP-4-amino-4,6-dideoxygalactose transaminase